VIPAAILVALIILALGVLLVTFWTRIDRLDDRVEDLEREFATGSVHQQSKGE
jgi:hypothetical protein